MQDRLVFGAFLLSTALVLLSAACGGGNGKESGSVIEVRADEYKFSPNQVTISAGQTVTLRLKNVGETEHDLEVQGLRVQMMGDEEDMGGHEGAAPGTIAMHTQKGKTASVTFMAERGGTYEFWCTISGHKEQGMIGKLIVN